MLIFSELKEPYFIAEIGENHNGDVELAKRMIRAAKACGANAVKFQLFDRFNLCTGKYMDELDQGIVKLENVEKWDTAELGLSGVREQIDAFVCSKEETTELREFCREVGIDFGCTPVDEAGIKFLMEIDSDFIKLSSMDANNPVMIEQAVRTGAPVIISTGMADLSEIDNIYRLIKGTGCKNFALLHCIAIYPPKDEIINLNFINSMQNLYDCTIGYSDHALGYSISLAAVAKGAMIIEKHFTMDKNMPGWDHKVSADESDMKIICQEGRRIFKAIGKNYKSLSDDELEKKKKFRRSLTSTRTIKAGEVIQSDDITFKRPGTGISPDLLCYVIGRAARKDIHEDKTLDFGDLI